jgi:hypothetical protein
MLETRACIAYTCFQFLYTYIMWTQENFVKIKIKEWRIVLFCFIISIVYPFIPQKVYISVALEWFFKDHIGINDQ